jgi:hypothetical protein
MKKFYTIEQIVSTRTAQIDDKGPGRIGALVSHQQLRAPRQARMESTNTRKDSAVFRWPCGEFEMSHIKQTMS